MNEIVFTVPGQPVAKGRARAVSISGKARLHTPQKTVQYESMVAIAAQTAMAGQPLFYGPVQLDITAVFSIPSSWPLKRQKMAANRQILPSKRPDIDNIAKAIQDGCNGVVYRDDAQVVKLIAIKQYGDIPGVYVQVRPL